MKSISGLILSVLLLGCDSAPRQGDPVPSQKLLPAQASIPQFSSEKAFDDLVRQTSFGPRAPGTQGYQKCLAFFQSTLSPLADTLIIQRFSYRSYKGDPYLGNNVIARFNLFQKERILLTAHWDTRPWADADQ